MLPLQRQPLPGSCEPGYERPPISPEVRERRERRAALKLRRQLRGESSKEKRERRARTSMRRQLIRDYHAAIAVEMLGRPDATVAEYLVFRFDTNATANRLAAECRDYLARHHGDKIEPGYPSLFFFQRFALRVMLGHAGTPARDAVDAARGARTQRYRAQRAAAGERRRARKAERASLKQSRSSLFPPSVATVAANYPEVHAVLAANSEYV